MSKYSYEFKKRVVLAYLNGEGGYRHLSKTFGVPAKRNIEQWVYNYKISSLIKILIISCLPNTHNKSPSSNTNDTLGFVKV